MTRFALISTSVTPQPSRCFVPLVARALVNSGACTDVFNLAVQQAKLNVINL